MRVLNILLANIFGCKHPFEKSRKLGFIKDSEKKDHCGYTHKVNVRQCGVCEQYFCDAGYE